MPMTAKKKALKGRVANAIARGVAAETTSVRERIARADRALGLTADREAVERTGVSMPKGELGILLQLLADLKDHRTPASKSEVFRAGLKLLRELPIEEVARRLEELPKVRTGRPPKRASI